MIFNWISVDKGDLVHDVTRLDTNFWAGLLTEREGLRKIFPRYADKVIGGDLFSLLYKWNPELKDESPDPALSAWMSIALNTPEVQELRDKTIGDRSIAAASAVNLYRELMRPKESQLKVIAQMKSNLDTVEVLGGEMSEDNKQILKELQEKMGEEFMDMPTDQVVGSLAGAADKVADDLDTAKQLGWSNDPYNQSAKVLDTMLNEQLVSRVTQNDKLRKIVKILGRITNILEVSKSKQMKQQPTPVDLVYGSDLDKLVPTELVYMDDLELEDIFWSKYLNRGLLQYQHRDKPKEGKGPFICCMDVSGSMHGEPEQYALALFTALARMAIKEKRKVGIIYFADRASSMYRVGSVEELVTALTATPKVGGGTDFIPPLNQAREQIDKEIVGKDADILFISDGYAGVDSRWVEEWVKWKERLGIRQVGINIGGRWGEPFNKVFDASSEFNRGEIGKLEWMEGVKEQMI